MIHAERRPSTTSWRPPVIFVFGSNLKGIHGAGAARHAKYAWGAQNGKGSGRQGNSYAIPTCSEPGCKLPPAEIKKYIEEFFKFARERPDTIFIMTSIGCGLAGHEAKTIASIFPDPSQWPQNVYAQNKLILGFMYGGEING